MQRRFFEQKTRKFLINQKQKQENTQIIIVKKIKKINLKKLFVLKSIKILKVFK